MSKTIIKKEVTEYGSIEIEFFGKSEQYSEIMRFDNELQLKAFAYLLSIMLETNADSISAE